MQAKGSFFGKSILQKVCLFITDIFYVYNFSVKIGQTLKNAYL